MALALRPATPGDAPGVAAIYAPVVREGYASFEDEAPGEGAPPSVRVSVAAGEAGARSVRVRLSGEGADAVDYWAIDWDYDGRVFRHAWRAGRQNAKGRVPLSAERTYAASGDHQIAVLIAGAGGQERREVIVWEAPR